MTRTSIGRGLCDCRSVRLPDDDCCSSCLEKFQGAPPLASCGLPKKWEFFPDFCGGSGFFS